MCRQLHVPFRRILVLAVVLLVVGDLSADEPLRDVIDRHIEAKWKAKQVTPSEPAPDSTFLRRIYLDLTGTIPTYEQAKSFLDDTTTDKRTKLIDQLLESDNYAAHQADVWDMVLMGRNPPGYDTKIRPGFVQWLQASFKKNTPYDQMVRAMLKAEGDTVDAGAPMFLVQYNRKPLDAVQAVVQKFMGVQLQCARCHDHPYEEWTQLDFYGMAAFLARTEVVEVGKKGKLKKFVVGEKEMGELDFTGPAAEDGPGKKAVTVKPKFLKGSELQEPEAAKDAKEVKFKSGKMPPRPNFSRKDHLADWITAAENEHFARAVANRVWAQFMGRGIVHPVDDMSAENEPSHPELLEALSKRLVANKYDLRSYIRELCSSKTYQLGEFNEDDAELPRWFQRARVRPLSAEELTASWRVATRYISTDSKATEKIATERYYPLTSGFLMSHLGEPANGEGDFQGGIKEHLFQNNGGLSKLFSRSKGGLFDSLKSSEASWEERVDELFVSVLSRYPDKAEREQFQAYLTADEKRPDDRIMEAMWALMTCSEFRFNH